MKLDKLKILYVCTDFPYPPTHGGLVDIWNRILALHGLGVILDVIVTTASEPQASDREKVENVVRRLMISRRLSGVHGLFSIRPGQAAIRGDLRRIKLDDQYDAVLMHTEFVTDILLNKTLKYRTSIIRVDNDEYAYYIQTAKAEQSWLRKLYFLQESVRIRYHTSRMLPAMDMLWFISHDELARYKLLHDSQNRQRTAFVPSAIDIRLLDSSPLEGSQVLFVGNLWTSLNKQAVVWYIQKVHRKLADIPGYKLVIAGSTRGQACEWLKDATKPFTNIKCYLDTEDLSSFYKASSAFVNPMQSGSGVKLKTVDAMLRGLPVVSTRVGAEGIGAIDGVHYKRADTPSEFATRIREFLSDRKIAMEFVKRAQEFVADHYDQSKVLEHLLEEVSDQCETSKAM